MHNSSGQYSHEPQTSRVLQPVNSNTPNKANNSTDPTQGGFTDDFDDVDMDVLNEHMAFQESVADRQSGHVTNTTLPQITPRVGGHSGPGINTVTPTSVPQNRASLPQTKTSLPQTTAYLSQTKTSLPQTKAALSQIAPRMTISNSTINININMNTAVRTESRVYNTQQPSALQGTANNNFSRVPLGSGNSSQTKPIQPKQSNINSFLSKGKVKEEKPAKPVARQQTLHQAFAQGPSTSFADLGSSRANIKTETATNDSFDCELTAYNPPRTKKLRPSNSPESSHNAPNQDGDQDVSITHVKEARGGSMNEQSDFETKPAVGNGWNGLPFRYLADIKDVNPANTETFTVKVS